jgi:hypothetical protein
MNELKRESKQNGFSIVGENNHEKGNAKLSTCDLTWKTENENRKKPEKFPV